MIFLIGKIFIYLFLAGAVGMAAGWLFRNLQAQRTEDAAQRAATDAKSKVPQLESLLRGRDEQIAKFKEMLTESKTELSEQDQAMRALEKQLREQQRETQRWQESADARAQAPVADVDDENDTTDDMIVELSGEIARLKVELEQARVGSSGATADTSLIEIELEALRGQLASAERKLEAAVADLEQERNRVAELVAERELQSKSLQVMHQQLELERTRRVANG